MRRGRSRKMATVDSVAFNSINNDLDLSRLKSSVEAFNAFREKFGEPIREFRTDAVNLQRAAVLLPFVVLNGEIKVLTTVRHPDISVHPNEVSFPGGAVEDDDEDPIATALREAYEEIGLNRHDVTIIGSIDEVLIPAYPRKKKNSISTFHIVSVVIGVLNTGFCFKMNNDEVSEIVFGSINCMFSSLEKITFGKNIETPTVKLNEGTEIMMYGFSTFVAIFACVILDLVPKCHFGRVKSVLKCVNTIDKYVPPYILNFIEQRLTTDDVIANDQSQVVSKI